MRTPFLSPLRSVLAWLAAVLPLALLAPAATAQITTTVRVASPMPRALSAWRSDPTLVQVTLRNTTGRSYDNLRLSFRVVGDGRGEVVRSVDGHPRQPRLSLGPNETQVLYVEDFFVAEAVTYPSALATEIARDGIPEDNYQFCARVLDAAAGNAEVGTTGPICPRFTVFSPDPPSLVAPVERDEVNPASLVFRWAFLDRPGAVPPQFRLKIVPVLRGQNATAAVGGNPALFNEVVSGTTYRYLPSDPAFADRAAGAVAWAWQVQALDADERPYGRNSGLSTIGEFTLAAEREAAGPLAFAPAWPVRGDTLPWSPQMLVVRWAPYANTYEQARFTVTLDGPGGRQTNTRDLSWGSGGPLSQTPGRDEGRANLHFVNVAGRPPSAVPWASTLRTGSTYTWTVEGWLRRQGAGSEASRQVTATPANGSFTAGMKAARLVYPAADERIAPGNVTFRWMPTRSDDFLPPDIVAIRQGEASMTFSAANQRARFELSRNADFSSPLLQREQTFAFTEATYETVLAEQSVATAEPLAEGTYYWRVSWIGADGSAYVRSARRFTVGAADPGPVAGGPRPAAPGQNCLAECTIALPSNRTVATGPASAYVGQTIRLGKFDVTITEAAGTAGSLSGRGTVLVPFMRAPLRVRLTGVQLNTDGYALAGRAVAETDREGVLPEAWMNSFDGAFGGETMRTVSTVNDLVADGMRLVSAFSGSTPVALPLGIDRTIEGTRWIIGIVGAEFTATSAKVNAVVDVPLPDTDARLGLGVKGLCINPNGIANEAKLTLVQDVVIPLRDVEGEANDYVMKFKAEGPGELGTFVSWNCHGFKELAVSMAHELPRDFLVPVNERGEELGTGKVTATFRFTVANTGDWLASGTLSTRAMVPNAPDFFFEINNIVYDNSTRRNPDGMRFPEGYRGPSRDNTWTGLYVQRVGMTGPPLLREAGAESRIGGFVEGLIVDRGGGVSLSAGLNNLLRLDSNPGSLDGWAFSVDTLAVRIVSSSLERGELVGDIRMPIGRAPLRYGALLSRPPEGETGLRFAFSVRPRATWSAELFGPATLSLQPSSIIEIGNTGPRGAFRARAIFNGALTLEGNVGGMPVSFRGVRFEGFGVQTQPEYFQQGTWSFASPQHVLGGSNLDDAVAVANGQVLDDNSSAGFPITIESFGLVTGTRNGSPAAGLRVAMAVRLPASFRAATTLSVWGRLDRDDRGNFAPQFHGIDLDRLCLGGDIGAVSIRDPSCIEFFHEDATFGNGFRGEVNVSFIGTVDIRARLQFGTVSGFDYWFADALATLPAPGLIIGSSPLAFYGFGGGAYYHMRQEARPDPQAVLGARATPTRYVPDRSVALGFMATVVLGTTPKPDVFNGDVTLRVDFTEAGGLRSINLVGNGYMLTGVNNRPERPPVRATVNILYDHVAQVFDASFGLDVYIAGGIVQGGGTAQIYAAPDRWFVRVGAPDPAQRMRLQVAFLTMGGYLWVGQGGDIPRFPDPLPPAPAISSDGRPTMEQMRVGTAIMFGANTGFHAGGKFLIFYGEVNAQMGFDLALRDFGANARCETESGRVINNVGINGWYADGQLYAGISADVGIEVDLLFTSGRFSIFNASIGATLRGGLPNPAWVKGAVQGHYNILGGAVSGEMYYEFQEGEVCAPLAASPLLALGLVSELEPRDGSRDVSVFVEPSAAFNMTVDEPFDLRDGRGRLRRYRVVTSGIQLRLDNERGAIVPGRTVRADDGSYVYFDPANPLEPETYYYATIAAAGEEWRENRWQPALNDDGQQVAQTRTSRFRTGTAPRQIAAEHVRYSYPFERQRQFMQNECRIGTVSLWEDYRMLLRPTSEESPRATVEVVARFEAVGDPTPIEVPATLTASGVQFTIPTLRPETGYAIQIVRRTNTPPALSVLSQLPAGGYYALSGGNSGNISLGTPRNTAISTSLSQSLPPTVSSPFVTEIARRQAVGLGSVTIRQRQLPGSRVNPGERLLYRTFFRTSRFGTLREKLAGTTVGPATLNQQVVLFLALTYLESDVTPSERFDLFDLTQQTRTYSNGRTHMLRPLVQASSPWTSSWASNYANPRIYDVRSLLQRYGWRFYSETYRDRAFRTGTNVSFGGRNPHDGPLTNSELMPPDPQMAYLASIMQRNTALFAWRPFVSSAPASSQRTVPLTVMQWHGTWAGYDRADLWPTLARAWATYTGEFFVPEIDRAYRTAWTPPTPGSYELQFTYNPPTCGYDPDSPQPFTPVQMVRPGLDPYNVPAIRTPAPTLRLRN